MRDEHDHRQHQVYDDLFLLLRRIRWVRHQPLLQLSLLRRRELGLHVYQRQLHRVGALLSDYMRNRRIVLGSRGRHSEVSHRLRPFRGRTTVQTEGRRLLAHSSQQDQAPFPVDVQVQTVARQLFDRLCARHLS